MPRSLADWLQHCERLHPKTIDLTLARMRLMRERMALAVGAPLVVVAGTNGKGSTCAMLEAIALEAGYRVGLHTSPHLLRFEERCRVGGAPVEAERLLPHFEAVEAARGDLELTFFEFTLLAIVRLLAASELDLVILEVGLGGRFDAVNAFDADCAIVTCIAIDHAEYLGATREAIAFEKAGILRPGKPAILGDPEPPTSLLNHARAIGAEAWLSGRDFVYSGDRLQWQWQGRERRYTGLAPPALRGANQLVNAAGVLAALEAMRERLPVTAQQLRRGLARVELPGRFQVVAGAPAIVLDVAHNPHAVAALLRNLEQMAYYPRTHAVFGAMRDKDLEAMLAQCAPLVDAWHFCDLPTPRAASAAELLGLLERLPAPQRGRGPAACHADPTAALRAAVETADPADRIVVFGSFYTVGGVLASGLPRTSAPHLR